MSVSVRNEVRPAFEERRRQLRSVTSVDAQRAVARSSKRPVLRVVGEGEAERFAGGARSTRRPVATQRDAQRARKGVAARRSARDAVERHGRASARSSAQLEVVDLVRFGIHSLITLAAIALFAIMGSFIGTAFLAPTDTITVGAGDNLASIAASIPGAPSTAEGVAAIRDLNGLTGDAIRPGQQLRVPRY